MIPQRVIDINTRVADLTVAELLHIIDCHIESQEDVQDDIKGIKGLADYLGCSVRTAQSIKSSGKIDSATKQIGRQVIFSKKKLSKLLYIHK